MFKRILETLIAGRLKSAEYEVAKQLQQYEYKDENIEYILDRIRSNA